MTDPIITAAQAEILALTESLRVQSVKLAEVQAENAELRAENAELRALLSRSKTSLSERFNDPAQGDPVEAPK
jgi:hypothetical protein